MKHFNLTPNEIEILSKVANKQIKDNYSEYEITAPYEMKKYTILMNGHPFQTNEFNCKKDALKRISNLQKWFKYSTFSLIFNK